MPARRGSTRSCRAPRLRGHPPAGRSRSAASARCGARRRRRRAVAARPSHAHRGRRRAERNRLEHRVEFVADAIELLVEAGLEIGRAAPAGVRAGRARRARRVASAAPRRPRESLRTAPSMRRAPAVNAARTWSRKASIASLNCVSSPFSALREFRRSAADRARRAAPGRPPGQSPSAGRSAGPRSSCAVRWPGSSGSSTSSFWRSVV